MSERVVHRVEGYIQRWRREDAALEREADANGDVLCAEAAERERMRKDAVYRESGDGSSGRVTVAASVPTKGDPKTWTDKKKPQRR